MSEQITQQNREHAPTSVHAQSFEATVDSEPDISSASQKRNRDETLAFGQQGVHWCRGFTLTLTFGQSGVTHKHMKQLTDYTPFSQPTHSRRRFSESTDRKLMSGFTPTPNVTLPSLLNILLAKTEYARKGFTDSVQKFFPAKRRHIRCRGFTLIEMLLYLALMTIMIAVLGGIGVNVLASNAKAHALEEVGYNAHFVFEKLRTAVNDASSIDGPTGNGTSSTLTLSMGDASKNPTVFTLADGILTMTESAGQPITLSTDGVTISSLQFRDVSYPASPSTVRIEMSIDAYNPEHRKAYDAGGQFYTTVGQRITP